MLRDAGTVGTVFLNFSTPSAKGFDSAMDIQACNAYLAFGEGMYQQESKE